LSTKSAILGLKKIEDKTNHHSISILEMLGTPQEMPFPPLYLPPFFLGLFLHPSPTLKTIPLYQFSHL